jgi:hypothetical protein
MTDPFEEVKQLKAISMLAVERSLIAVIGSGSRYWRLVRLDGTGRRRVEEMPIAKAFFHQQFADWVQRVEPTDAVLQQRLMDVLQDDQAAAGDRDGAERCLRCFISHQIEHACIQLETKFGDTHGFTRTDLFPLVLDDDGLPKPPLGTAQPSYQTLASEILRTFDPQRAALSTWSTRLVRQHEELTRFLREHGVDLITDWAILNNTTPEQMRRILAEFHRLTPTEITHAQHLLHSYHQVYRLDRLQQRQSGTLKSKTVCAPPTREQLTRIAETVPIALADRAPEQVFSKLQTLATQLRQYRLHIRGGQSLASDSLDRPETSAKVAEIPAHAEEQDDPVQDAFLTFYRQRFAQELDIAIAQVTRDRVAYLQRKNRQNADHFLTALQLFHCQGRTMSEIAQKVGLQAQFQVTRLMKLKEFRTAIRQHLLTTLFQSILDQAKVYTDITKLQQFDQQIELALAEQIDTLIKQAESEATVAKHRPLTSVLARRLCHYLDQFLAPS